MAKKSSPKLDARSLLALNMKRLRKERGWSQDALALEAGLDRTFIAHVERLRRNISLDNIERIAGALDIPIRVLFEETTVGGFNSEVKNLIV